MRIRMALDEREGNTERKRQKVYEELCQYGAHATYKGFRMTTRGNIGELGPFLDEKMLRAFIEECTLRIVPGAVLYSSLFPAAPAHMLRFRQEVVTLASSAVKQDEE
jgi:hypothetical protein